MSEKRFTVDGLNIQDTSIKGRLYLLDEQGGVNALCNLINGLNNKINRLEEENEQLKKQLNKKNTMNMQLREINKDLGDDLHNCRLNKNIIREKLKLWQDVHKEYDIYSIKDFEELMKNDK